MTASEKKWLAKTSDIVVDQFEGHNDEDLSTALVALTSGDSIIEKTIPRQVIVVNPDIAVTDEIEGKLYRTYDAAYEYTHESPDTDFEIQLPAGEISGRLKVDNNLILQGSHTLIEGIDSYCYYEIDSTYGPADVDVHGGIVRNCVLQGGSGPSSQTNIIRVDYGSPVVTHQAYIIFNNCTIYGTDFDIDGDVSRPAAKLIFTHCDLYWDDDLGYIVDPGSTEHNPCSIIIESCTVKPGAGSNYPAVLKVGCMDTLTIRNSAFEYQTTLEMDDTWDECRIIAENSTFETLTVQFDDNRSVSDLEAHIRFHNCVLGSTSISTATPSGGSNRTQAILFNGCCWRKQDGSTSQFEPITLDTNSNIWLIGSNASLGATGGTSETFHGRISVLGKSVLTMASSGTGNCYAIVYVDASSYFDPSQVGTGPVFGGAVTRTALPVRYATDASGTGMSATDTGQAYVGLMLVDGRDVNTASSYTWIQRASGGGGGSVTTEKAGGVITVNTSLAANDTSRLLFNNYADAKTYAETQVNNHYVIELDRDADYSTSGGTALAMPTVTEVPVKGNNAIISDLTYTVSGTITDTTQINGIVPSATADSVLTIEGCDHLNLGSMPQTVRSSTTLVIRNSTVSNLFFNNEIVPCNVIFDHCEIKSDTGSTPFTVGVSGNTSAYSVSFSDCRITGVTFSVADTYTSMWFERCELNECIFDKIATTDDGVLVAFNHCVMTGFTVGDGLATSKSGTTVAQMVQCCVRDGLVKAATSGSYRDPTIVLRQTVFYFRQDTSQETLSGGEMRVLDHSVLTGVSLSLYNDHRANTKVFADLSSVVESNILNSYYSSQLTYDRPTQLYFSDNPGSGDGTTEDRGQMYVGLYDTHKFGITPGTTSTQDTETSMVWFRRAASIYSLEMGNLYFSGGYNSGDIKTSSSISGYTYTVHDRFLPQVPTISTTNTTATVLSGDIYPAGYMVYVNTLNQHMWTYGFSKWLDSGTWDITVVAWIENLSGQSAAKHIALNYVALELTTEGSSTGTHTGSTTTSHLCPATTPTTTGTTKVTFGSTATFTGLTGGKNYWFHFCQGSDWDANTKIRIHQVHLSAVKTA